MRHQIISLSKAKEQLLALARQVNEEGRAFVLTKDGVPVGALVPMEEYEALSETSEVLANSNVIRSLKKALEEEKAGKLWNRDKSGKWIKHK
jgi:prevent-host-death family protein